MVEYEDEELAARIKKAFTDAPYPGDDRLVLDLRHFESGEVVHAFAGRHWKELPLDFLSAHLMSRHNFTPEAFRYYLPAYLLASLRRLSPAEAETGAVNIPEAIVYDLIPARREGFAFDDFQARVSGLTLEQKIVLRDFLRWWDQVVREDWPGRPPEDEVEIAGRRYWESIDQA